MFLDFRDTYFSYFPYFAPFAQHSVGQVADLPVIVPCDDSKHGNALGGDSDSAVLMRLGKSETGRSPNDSFSRKSCPIQEGSGCRGDGD